jgi:hypothetical protein
MLRLAPLLVVLATGTSTGQFPPAGATPSARPRRSAADETARPTAAARRPARAAPVARPVPRDYLRAIVKGDFEGARAALDQRLQAGSQVSLPVGREKSGGVDQWNLVITPTAVALTQYLGALKTDAPISDTKVEDTGIAKPTLDNKVRTNGTFVRLKLKGKKFNLYFWPPEGECHEAQRFLSFNTFLQCAEAGAAMQEFVALYVAETLERLGATRKPEKGEKKKDRDEDEQ